MEKTAERLANQGYNLYYSTTGGRGPHGVVRDCDYSPDNIRSLITTVQKDLYKQRNQQIFKQFLDFDVKEDDIWEALGML